MREVRAAVAAAEHRADLAREKMRLLNAAFIYDGKIDQDVYDVEKSRLSAEIAEALSEVETLRDDGFDFEPALRYAVELLRQPAAAWRGADTDQKQRLQKVFFPDGVTFRAGRFETANKGILFSGLTGLSAGESRLVAHTGFEPVLPP